MTAAATGATRKITRARHGHNAEGGRTPRDVIATPPPQTPLNFALSIMRDDNKPDALRVTMAKAAMPYLHKRGEAQENDNDTPPEEPMSDFELARRIAHILHLGESDGFRQLEAARETARLAEEKARAAEARAHELECRAQSEAIATRKTERDDESGNALPSSHDPVDAGSDLAALQEKLRVAEERARVSEAQVQDLHDRLLANEEILANAYETRRRRY